ncbi:hypothetical protein SAMN06265360_102109 [Haloechinothrix alba]|uniref:Uncharacterized protein n=1 Tax=Haloechinothrix alba TaxID=664784 RepID=A0A238VD99_9PSEU|nr:hypothetical protein [Haloechinothrix alba]SNR32390.1 hypothetical protein SAMN06265360_102109 [Haloechinothrix alba]
MSYPQYPAQGGYPAMPAYPGYTDAEPPASGGTAITAGVLACLCGLFALWGAVQAFMLSAMSVEMFDAELTAGERARAESAIPGWTQTAGFIGGSVQLVIVGLLIGGAVLLFMKKAAGRWMVASGCALVILFSIASFILTWVVLDSMVEEFAGQGSSTGPSAQEAESVLGAAMVVGGIAMFFVLLPAIVTLVLALVRPTRRWCEQGTGSVSANVPPYGAPPPYAGHPPQQPGYPPQQPMAPEGYFQRPE